MESQNNGSVVDNDLRRGADRRQYRRHDLEPINVAMDRCDAGETSTQALGKIVDLSAGGVRIRTDRSDVRPDSQIHVRLELPTYAGISPFITAAGADIEPKTEWVGWLNVMRVKTIGPEQYEVAGKLLDMDELDRGMLGLYLSTQPLAA